jgi:hypothetical protein
MTHPAGVKWAPAASCRAAEAPVSESVALTGRPELERRVLVENGTRHPGVHCHLYFS